MTDDRQLVNTSSPTNLATTSSLMVPKLFASAGEQGTFRFLEFFTAQIRNKNTRAAYAQAVGQFALWCENLGIELEELTSLHLAAYVEGLGEIYAKPTVKQHLAAIRMLFDYLVSGQIVATNPAASVRGPKYSIRKGKTPVLNAEEARILLDSIDVSKMAGLRDRALIAVMVYSFARISAVLGMNVEDYYLEGRRWWIRLDEKGGKEHAVPAHHKIDEYLGAYIEAAGIEQQRGEALFRSVDRKRQLTGRRFLRQEALPMVKKRARAAGLGETLCNHSFRATGITNFLENGGTVEKAQQIAAHESPRTTKLYDRTDDEVNVEEIERIRI